MADDNDLLDEFSDTLMQFTKIEFKKALLMNYDFSETQAKVKELREESAKLEKHLKILKEKVMSKLTKNQQENVLLNFEKALIACTEAEFTQECHNHENGKNSNEVDENLQHAKLILESRRKEMVQILGLEQSTLGNFRRK